MAEDLVPYKIGDQMTKPKAYSPLQGSMYQLLLKSPYNRGWEYLDYAESESDMEYLMTEYRLAYRGCEYFQIRAIKLPKKYWSEK